MTTQRFPVGTRFARIVPASRGKVIIRVCTVTDFWTTRDIAGDIVQTRYTATHEFLGQQVEDRDVTDTSIARGVARLAEMEA